MRTGGEEGKLKEWDPARSAERGNSWSKKIQHRASTLTVVIEQNETTLEANYKQIRLLIDGASPSFLYSVLVYHKHLRTVRFYLKSNTVRRDVQVLQKRTTIITLRIVETETTHKVNSFALDSRFRYQKVKTSIQQVLRIDKIFFWFWMRQK